MTFRANSGPGNCGLKEMSFSERKATNGCNINLDERCSVMNMFLLLNCKERSGENGELILRPRLEGRRLLLAMSIYCAHGT